LALALDPAVVGLRSRIAAADLLAGAYHPFVEGAASATVSYRSDWLGSGAGAREYEAEVSTPVWLPDERATAERAAQAELAVLRATLDLAVLAVAGRLRAAWIDVRRSEAVFTTTDRAAQGAEALVASTRQLKEAGEAPQADLVLAQAAAADARAQLATAQAEVTAARAVFNALTGAESATFVDASLSVEPPADGHPLLRLRRAERAAGVANARRANLAGYPSPEVGIMARRERGIFGQDYEHSFGLRLTVPLGKDPGTGAAVAAARADARQAEAALEADSATLEAQRLAAEARFAAAEANVVAARVRRDRMGEVLGFTERAHREGEVGFVELLRARSAHADAERAAALAIIDRDAAQGALAQALGILP
jgi:outer membrane protein TolC